MAIRFAFFIFLFRFVFLYSIFSVGYYQGSLLFGQCRLPSTGERFLATYEGGEGLDRVLFRGSLYNADGNSSNIRVSPGGRVLRDVPNSSLCEVELMEAWDGWFRIRPVIRVDGRAEQLASESAWVYGAVLGARVKSVDSQDGARTTGSPSSLPLYSTSSYASDTVCFIPRAGQRVKFMDIRPEWVRIRVRDGEDNLCIGWVPTSWLDPASR